MAEKKAEAAEGEGAPKKKGKLLLFIIIGVLAVVLGGGGAFFALKKKSHADDEEGDEPAAKTEKASKSKKDHPDAPPVFVKFEPFTVKLQPDGPQTEAYLQTTPELRVLDAPVGDKIKLYTPEIRHKVLLVMSGKKPSEISSPQGVQKLANEMRNEINLIVDGPKTKGKGKGKGKAKEEPPAESSDEPSPDDSVQAVLFTSFIIQ